MELKFQIVTFDSQCLSLLIVPYGIEINITYMYEPLFFILLIVPYGIEMFYLTGGTPSDVSFNRTLWN